VLENIVFKLSLLVLLVSLSDLPSSPERHTSASGRSMEWTQEEDVVAHGTPDVKGVFATKSTRIVNGREKLFPTSSTFNANGDKRTNNKDKDSAVLGRNVALVRNVTNPKEDANGLDTLSPTHGTTIVNGDKRIINLDKNTVVVSIDFVKTIAAKFKRQIVHGKVKPFHFTTLQLVTMQDFPSFQLERNVV
jgi:hypothetical protein